MKPGLLSVIMQAALISQGSSYMAITIPFLLVAIYILQAIYLRTSRQLRFMDLEAKSPVYSHFLETLDGLATIRAFGWQQQFRVTSLRRLDESQRPYYLLFCIQRWLNLVLDLMVAVLAVIVVSLAVTLRNSTSAGSLGVALNNVLGFTASLTHLVTFWTQLETSLGAIARLKNFEITVSPEETTEENVTPPENWPEYGAIDFRNVTAAYGYGSICILLLSHRDIDNGRPTALALRDVSFSIAPGEKIGVCGRTGRYKLVQDAFSLKQY